MKKIDLVYVWADKVVALNMKGIRRNLLDRFKLDPPITWFLNEPNEVLNKYGVYRVKHVESGIPDKFKKIKWYKPIFAIERDEAEQTGEYQDISLEDARNEQLDFLKRTRDEVDEYPIEYSGSVFQCDDASLTRMRRAQDLLTDLDTTDPDNAPHTQLWRDINNVWQGPFDPSDLLAMSRAKGLQGLTNWGNFGILEAQVKATESVADLRAIDLTSGWPEKPE